MTDISPADYIAISNVLSRYCHLTDLGETDRLSKEVFSPDARLKYSAEPQIGSAAIDAFFGQVSGHAGTMCHFIGSVAITADGEGARSTTYYQPWRWEPESAVRGSLRAADSAMIGAYEERCVRTPAGWRISFRKPRTLGPGPMALGNPPAQFVKLFEERVGG